MPQPPQQIEKNRPWQVLRHPGALEEAIEAIARDALFDYDPADRVSRNSQHNCHQASSQKRGHGAGSRGTSGSRCA